MDTVDLSGWIGGWIALAFVVAYALQLAHDAARCSRARNSIPDRILVTGTRGKSGTVRLIQAALYGGDRLVFAKMTGTQAAQIDVNGNETKTVRLGAASVSEMPRAVLHASLQRAQIGIFECMAVTPSLIDLVQQRMIRAQIIAIPTVRLDHLEEEGLTELEIGMSMLKAVGKPDVVVCGVTQPEIIAAYQQHASSQGFEIIFTAPTPDQPELNGHHPVNIAVALCVAEIFGVDRETALERIRDVSQEPRAITCQRLARADGATLTLVDLGGANDPESSREAFEATGLDRDTVIPVLVNRWERPLRSLSFIGAVIGRFRAVAVAGTLYQFARKLDLSLISKTKRLYDATQFVPLSHRVASHRDQLWGWAEAFPISGDTRHRTIVLLENTHDPIAEAIRKLFDREAETVELISRRSAA